MLMETDDSRFDPVSMARAEASNARLLAWEALMWQFQAPTPWTPAGMKWMPGELIFDFASEDAAAARATT
jgi:L-rhamnose mutarotase